LFRLLEHSSLLSHLCKSPVAELVDHFFFAAFVGHRFVVETLESLVHFQLDFLVVQLLIFVYFVNVVSRIQVHLADNIFPVRIPDCTVKKRVSSFYIIFTVTRQRVIDAKLIFLIWLFTLVKALVPVLLRKSEILHL